MRHDSTLWQTREKATASVEEDIDFQGAYVRDLVTRTDYPEFDIEGMAELFKMWKHDKQEDILGYRNRSYRSTMTGTMAPSHHTPWIQALDDSLDAFLSDQPEQTKAA